MTDVNALSVKNAMYNLALNCRTTLSNHSATVLDWDMILSSAPSAPSAQSAPPLPAGVTVCDVVLGADIICCEADSIAVARCISKLLTPNTGIAYIALTTGRWRFGVDQFPTNLSNVGLVCSTVDIPPGSRPDLLQGADLTATPYDPTLVGFQLHRITWPGNTGAAGSAGLGGTPDWF
jgi:hypothetical protein